MRRWLVLEPISLIPFLGSFRFRWTIIVTKVISQFERKVTRRYGASDLIDGCSTGSLDAVCQDGKGEHKERLSCPSKAPLSSYLLQETPLSARSAFATSYVDYEVENQPFTSRQPKGLKDAR